MNAEKNKHVCPVERAGSLDNSLRRLLQNPNKILKPYIKKGTTILDLGCGPGFFTIEAAKILNNLELHKCEDSKIGVSEKVDFVLAFYMIHEVPDQQKLFEELKFILKPGGKIFIVEPKFHVSKKEFSEMIINLKHLGFDIIRSPKLFLSRTVLVTS